MDESGRRWHGDSLAAVWAGGVAVGRFWLDFWHLSHAASGGYITKESKRTISRRIAWEVAWVVAKSVYFVSCVDLGSGVKVS